MTKRAKRQTKVKPDKDIDEQMFNALFKQETDDPPHLTALALVKRFHYANDIYLEGFKEAADSLFSTLSSEGKANVLVYPLIYLLRHSIELSLKQTTLDFRRLNQSKWNVNSADLFNSHNFNTLVDLLRREFSESPYIDFSVYKENMEDLFMFLDLWERADPEGFVFRYATDKKGKIWVPDVNIYVGRIFQLSDRAYWSLYGLRQEIDQVKDYLAETKRENE